MTGYQKILSGILHELSGGIPQNQNLFSDCEKVIPECPKVRAECKKVR
jgi:hypothetical protein